MAIMFFSLCFCLCKVQDEKILCFSCLEISCKRQQSCIIALTVIAIGKHSEANSDLDFRHGVLCFQMPVTSSFVMIGGLSATTSLNSVRQLVEAFGPVQVITRWLVSGPTFCFGSVSLVSSVTIIS